MSFGGLGVARRFRGSGALGRGSFLYTFYMWGGGLCLVFASSCRWGGGEGRGVMTFCVFKIHDDEALGQEVVY